MASTSMTSSMGETIFSRAEISPVGDPSIHDLDVGPGKPMSFRVVTEVWPDVEVTGYEDLEIEQEVDPVTVEDIDEALQGIRSSRAEETPVMRASVAGELSAVLLCSL